MIALFAGTGALPGLIVRRLVGQVMVCQMAGFPANVPPETEIITYRIENIGPLLDLLRGRGVTRIVMAGALQRPVIDRALIDDVSAPYLVRLDPALGLGDDGTLRAVMSMFEGAGFAIIAAQDLLPDLLPPPGIPTRKAPGRAARLTAGQGPATVATMGLADSGQACVLRGARVLVTEGPQGTDAMLTGLKGAAGGLLYKAPKPGQDRRADLPVIGPATVTAAAQAGLDGIVIAAGGVMVVDLPEVIHRCDATGLFLWIRPE